MMGNETTLLAPAEFDTEADAYAFLERLRWGDDGPTECPHCGSEKGAWFLKPKDPEGRISKGGSSARSQRRVWKCRENSCRRQFSVLTNTVLHATKMPVRVWVGAVMELCLDPVGVSARDIANRWDVTEKSAWAMLNRIQDALAEPGVADPALGSNTPVWLEMSTGQRSSVEQERARRDRSAAEVLEARRRLENRAADRVQRAVQRARLEAKGEREESDVEGALVEAFDQHVTSTKAPHAGHSSPSEQGRDSQSGVATKGPNEASKRPSTLQPDADDVRTREPRPAAAASATTSTEEQQTPTSGSRGNDPAEKPANRSQAPVDNSPIVEPTGREPSNIPDAVSNPGLSPLRVRKRREQAETSGQKRPKKQRVQEAVTSLDAGSLGVGWLDRPEDEPAIIEAPELGPAWISAPDDMSNE